ncbi:hypothetical protein [Streptosporangium sp. NPDC051022]|uniref:hypothetical protein n=1 Tax=Streptosporangium sp. NPDC051022 TaxID=3155752 RepID=UPI0034252442
MGALRGLSGDGSVMTDPIACPECEGRRGQQLGGLFLACRFCGGRGQVGGEHEPAERGGDREPPPRPAAWEHRVWSDPAVAAVLPCRYCLGARTVSHIDQESRRMTATACPACA